MTGFLYILTTHMVPPSHRLSGAKHLRRPCALSLEPPRLDLPTDKMGPDSYACSLSRITASSPDPSARMPPEARDKARLLIMQAPSGVR